MKTDAYPRNARISRIKTIVASHFQIDTAFMCARKRIKKVVLAKQIAIGITREVLGAQTPELMRAFNLHDHHTVTNSIHNLQEKCEKQIKVAIAYQALYRTCLRAAGYPNEELA